MLSRYFGDVRRNHALEHATVSLLLSRLGPNLRLVGRASGDGFFIYGSVPSEVLSQCAQEGLARLQRGEGYWAVTPLCGTNIATAGVLTALASLAVAGNGQKGRLGTAIAAAMLAVTAAQPLGRLIQQHLTTSPDLEGTQIVSVETRAGGRLHKVRTRRQAA
ncbi:MAG TPA: DUF6391 domain-containing protein [Dehalococcoidia bacterium]|nr:DUF6391 domain-containing protein [Dehalococcoidia bacterium]